MEKQLSIFDFGVDDSSVIHFDNESLPKNTEVIEIKVEDLDFNDEYTSIA